MATMMLLSALTTRRLGWDTQMPTQLQRMSVQRPSLRACKPRLSQAGTCEARLSVGSLYFPTGVAGGTSSACLVFACNVFGPGDARA